MSIIKNKEVSDENRYHSQYAQETLGKFPMSLLRWCYGILALIFAIIIIIGYTIKYPNIKSINDITLIVTDLIYNTSNKDNIEEMIGIIGVPVNDTILINIGQKINIKLNDYPYMEYGVLRGEVCNKYINNVIINDKSENFHIAEIRFSLKNTPFFYKKINVNQVMYGMADITVGYTSLLCKLLNLKDVYNKKTN